MILNQWQLKLTPKDTEESNALAVLWKNLNPEEIVIPVAPREIWLLLRSAGSLTVVISVGLELQKEGAASGPFRHLVVGVYIAYPSGDHFVWEQDNLVCCCHIYHR